MAETRGKFVTHVGISSMKRINRRDSQIDVLLLRLWETAYRGHGDLP